MKVMCIEQSDYSNSLSWHNNITFTIKPGEWLEVYDNTKDIVSYTFERNGYEWLCEKYKFITVQQWREKQLDKLI
jgi:hypothetical protein